MKTQITTTLNVKRVYVANFACFRGQDDRIHIHSRRTGMISFDLGLAAAAEDDDNRSGERNKTRTTERASEREKESLFEL